VQLHTDKITASSGIRTRCNTHSNLLFAYSGKSIVDQYSIMVLQSLLLCSWAKEFDALAAAVIAVDDYRISQSFNNQLATSFWSSLKSQNSTTSSITASTASTASTAANAACTSFSEFVVSDAHNEREMRKFYVDLKSSEQTDAFWQRFERYYPLVYETNVVDDDDGANDADTFDDIDLTRESALQDIQDALKTSRNNADFAKNKGLPSRKISNRGAFSFNRASSKRFVLAAAPDGLNNLLVQLSTEKLKYTTQTSQQLDQLQQQSLSDKNSKEGDTDSDSGSVRSNKSQKSNNTPNQSIRNFRNNSVSNIKPLGLGQQQLSVRRLSQQPRRGSASNLIIPDTNAAAATSVSKKAASSDRAKVGPLARYASTSKMGTNTIAEESPQPLEIKSRQAAQQSAAALLEQKAVSSVNDSKYGTTAAAAAAVVSGAVTDALNAANKKATIVTTAKPVNDNGTTAAAAAVVSGAVTGALNAANKKAATVTTAKPVAGNSKTASNSAAAGGGSASTPAQRRKSIKKSDQPSGTSDANKTAQPSNVSVPDGEGKEVSAGACEELGSVLTDPNLVALLNIE
jgi:hypothetical protein